MSKSHAATPVSYAQPMGRGTGRTRAAGGIQKRITLSCQPAAPSADDYESGLGDYRQIRAQRGGQDLGCVTYSVREDHLRILYIEVNEDQRHHGIGTALITKMTKQHPGLALTTGGFTDDGHAFFESLGNPIEEERDPLLDNE